MPMDAGSSHGHTASAAAGWIGMQLGIELALKHERLGLNENSFHYYLG